MDPPLIGLGALLLGAMIAAVGILSLLLSLFGRRRPDPLLASFGAFALLYGVRLFFDGPLIGALGVSELAAAWVRDTITYLINIPAWFFFFRLLGHGLWSLAAWCLGLVSVFAAVGISSDLVQGQPGTLRHPNNVVVLAALALLVFLLIRSRERRSLELRVLVAGLTVFGLLAVNDNLVSIGLLPWRWQEEWIGFVVFAGCLGFIAARRFFVNERQLAALEGELATARRIQLSILPRALPETAGLALAARFRPTSAVAGDLYDFLAVDRERLAIVVADVSGHGVPAALIASMVKVAVASQGDHAAHPALLLTEVNRALRGSFERGFVTATCVYLDTANRALVAANAGHPAPLLRRGADGAVIEVGGQGPILGRFADAVFAQEKLTLEPGDRLVLYTDGLTEARGPGGDAFGEERLRAFTAAAGQPAPEAFCDELLAELRRWAAQGAEPALADDLTLVVADFHRAR